MDTSEKMFISFFVVLIVGLIVLNLVLFFNNNKNKSDGGKETHTCKDGTTFTCYGGTEGCMDNSPMHCPTVTTLGFCCNKKGYNDGTCAKIVKQDICNKSDSCSWQTEACKEPTTCIVDNGHCNVGIIQNGKNDTRACVGGMKLCGIAMNVNNRGHATQDNCQIQLNKNSGNTQDLSKNLINCETGFKPATRVVDPANKGGGECQFYCEKIQK